MAASIPSIIIEKVLSSRGKKSLATIDGNSVDAIKTNTDLLMKIIRDNKDTEYGKLCGFADITTIDQYRDRVPLSDYDTFAPYLERMVRKGEKNLITAYDVIQYAETSGTVGVQKKIPVTDKCMALYSNNTITRVSALVDEYYRTHGHKLPYGRGLNTLETESTVMDDGTPRGSVSGSVARTYKRFFPYYLTSPIPILFPQGGMNMQYMKGRFALEDKGMVFMFSSFMTTLADVMNYIKNNWPMICDDIEHGTVNDDVCTTDEARARIQPYLKPRPARAAELRAIFDQGFSEPVAPKIWPNLSWICAIGTGGFASYTERMKTYTGDIPIDFSVYAASEGIFAACRHVDDPRFNLLLDSCFYEFIPAEAPDSTTDTLTLDQLEVGKEYEIIVTNQCGFYRYRIKDVVRVLGFDKTCPLITFAYRKSQVVNIAAEKTTEEHLDTTVKRMGEQLGCEFADYCIYIDTDAEPARYIMVLEPDHDIPIKTKEYLELFEKILCEVNPEYAVVRYDRSLGDPVVLIQQQQTHALWREMRLHKGSSPNQVKPIRVLDVPMKQKFFFGLLEEDQEDVFKSLNLLI